MQLLCHCCFVIIIVICADPQKQNFNFLYTYLFLNFKQHWPKCPKCFVLFWTNRNLTGRFLYPEYWLELVDLHFFTLRRVPLVSLERPFPQGYPSPLWVLLRVSTTGIFRELSGRHPPSRNSRLVHQCQCWPRGFPKPSEMA